HQPIVAGRAARGLGGKCRMGEEAELAQTVIDGDDDDIVRHQRARIVPVALANDQPSTVNPEHHGKQMRPSPVRLAGSEDVQKQTVFCRARYSVGAGNLRTVRPERRRVQNPCPARKLLRGRQRRSPTGASAYGMPRNCWIVFVPMPRTGPVSVTTTGELDAAAAAGTPATSEHASAAATLRCRIQALRIIAPPASIDAAV